MVMTTCLIGSVVVGKIFAQKQTFKDYDIIGPEYGELGRGSRWQSI